MSKKTSYGTNVYNVYNSLKHHFRIFSFKFLPPYPFTIGCVCVCVCVWGGGVICRKPLLAVLIKASIYKCTSI